MLNCSFDRGDVKHTTYLRRRHRLKSLGNLLLPSKPRLSVNLRGGLEACTQTAVVQEDGAQDDVLGHDVLLVVDVRGAVLAVILIATLLA